MFRTLRWCLLLSLLCASLVAAGSDRAVFRPGAVLLQLEVTSSLAATRTVLPPDVAIEESLGSGSYVVSVPRGAEQRYATELTALPGVVYAQPDHRVVAQLQPNDPRYAEQWNLERIGMPQVWSVVTDTSSLLIATLDSGVELQHPELRDQLWTNPGEIPGNRIDDDANGYVDDLHGWHFYQIFAGGKAYPQQDANLDDLNGHGTHVAGIIAAAGNNAEGVTGVAWRARLMVVRVLDDDAIGWESDIIRGLSYAVMNGARVVNLSLGMAQATPALANAVAQAETAGVLLVAAAGNNNGAVMYPAAYPTVLSVGASTRDDDRATFSSYGEPLDLLAPGVDILSTWNGLPYHTRSGTSMAAPHAAGAAALVWTRLPQATPRQIRSCLIGTAADLGIAGRDTSTGWGLLDAARAVQGCPRHVFLPQVAHP